MNEWGGTSSWYGFSVMPRRASGCRSSGGGRAAPGRGHRRATSRSRSSSGTSAWDSPASSSASASSLPGWALCVDRGLNWGGGVQTLEGRGLGQDNEETDLSP